MFKAWDSAVSQTYSFNPYGDSAVTGFIMVGGLLGLGLALFVLAWALLRRRPKR